MRRLLCLALCLVVAPDCPPGAGSADRTAIPPAPPPRDARDDGGPLPDAATMERLARTDPIAFLENCLRRYDREVRGYRAVLRMQERLGGRLHPTEAIDVAFREKPFSVLLSWREGAGRAARTLYVKGENDDKLLARPSGALAYRLAGIVSRDPAGPDAREAGRYPLTEFGIKIGTERVLAAWEAARKQETLHVEYLGQQRVHEAGQRRCWVLRRNRFARPEEDGITEVTLYVDVETWLQVGTVLKGAGNRLIGEYFFRDIRLNPDFPPGTFTRAALEK
jgi:hypothetical protein